MSKETKHSLTSIAETEVVIEVEGKIVSANFQQIRDQVTEAMARINYEPKTDKEFGICKSDIKGLKSLESGFKTAREEGLKKASDLYEFFEGMNETTEEIRQNRLKLEKCVKEQTAKVKAEYLGAAVDMMESKNKEFFRPRLEGTMARKSSVDAIKAALNAEVLLINSEVKGARAVIAEYVSEHGKAVAMDEVSLEVMDPDLLTQTLSARAATLKAEAEKKKAEEEAKAAEAEGQRLRAEAAAKAEEERKAKEAAESKVDEEPKEEPKEEAQKPAEEPAEETQPESSLDPLPDTRAAEWRKYRADVMTVLSGLKPLRESLNHDENSKNARAFSRGINELFAKHFPE